MEEDRRRLLKSIGMLALVPLLGSAVPAAAEPRVVAMGGVFLVNGWVLTRADLTALGLRAR